MKTETAELVESGEKRDGRGRRIVPMERRRELIAEYERSGLTQKVFAEREGLAYGTFVAWIGRQRRGGTPGGVTASVFHELSLAGTPAPGLEVQLPSGLTIRGRSVPEIAELVRALTA
jgi:hypothetical protein